MGVANQYSALLSLLVLAVAARIQLVLLPPSLSRSNWTASADWRAGPASELWDLQSMNDFLASGSVKLQVPDQFQGAGSYETAALDCSLMPRSLALLGHSMDIADAAIILNQHITDRLAALPGSAESSYTLHFIIPPDLAFTLRTASSGLYRHAMRTVKFAPKVRKLATRVLQHLQKDAHNFNGLHLRLESDYESLLLAHGPRGFDNEAASYLRALKQHGCDSKTLLYIGSGVFSEAERRAGNELNKKVRLWLRAGAWRRVSAAIVHKEEVLPQGLLKSLTSEQLAAVDVLVLAQSQRFLGHSVSSMSWLVQELRALAGKPRESSFMLGAWPNNTRLYQQTYTVKDP